MKRRMFLCILMVTFLSGPAFVSGMQDRRDSPQFDPSRFTPPQNSRNSRLTELDQGLDVPPQLGLRQDREMAIGRLEGSKLFLDICTVHLIDDIKLPAREVGQISEIKVREGQPFKAGQLLAQLDYGLYSLALERAQLQYENAFEKANDTLGIVAAESQEQLQKMRFERNIRLNRSGSVGGEELDISRYEYEVAVLTSQRERLNKKMAEGDLKIEEANIAEVKERIARHQLVVDFDGYVIERLKQRFEWVNAGEPVLRVGRMDQLEIHALVDARLVDPHRIRPNQTATVTLNMADGKKETFEGKISSVALVRESIDVFRIKAEVNNRLAGTDAWLLQPLSKVSMVVELN